MTLFSSSGIDSCKIIDVSSGLPNFGAAIAKYGLPAIMTASASKSSVSWYFWR